MQNLLEESSENSDAVRLTAEIRSIVFSNEENGWTVARATAKGEPGMTTVVGCLGKITPGEVLEMTGKWKEHSKFGRQFEVSSSVTAYPATENGIIRYLSSGLIRGIGKTMAKRMVDAFGTDVLEVLDTDPDMLLKVEGIGKKKLMGIVESWESQREIRTLMLFLQTHEVPTTFAGRIFKLWGSGAIRKLQENPYELAYEIRGIGFRTADNMALKLGFAPDALQRIEAAAIYSLFTFSERGHLFYPADGLFERVYEMLDGSIGNEKFEQALASLEEKKRIRIEDLPGQGIERAVYLYHFYKYERETTDRLHYLISHPAPETTRRKVEKALPGLEREASINLSAEQREAVVGACANKVFIITGGPGTGKTTITRMIVRSLADVGLKLKLAAPTGRAAKRMSEAAGMHASTIHRLLQYQPDGGFQIGDESKLKADAVIVDEASMLDAWLFVSLLRALPLTCRLILVGDINQLPSVGPGNVLADLLESAVVPHARLTHIYRQAMESYIVQNAHRVNEGEYPHEAPNLMPPEKDFWWVVQDDPKMVQRLIVQSVCERIPAAYGYDPKRDIQVLTPMHKGDVGTIELNRVLQDRINPGKREIVRGYTRFREGDRVLQLRNNYDKDVFNGDLGWVDSIDFGSNEVLVDFEGRLVNYESSELDELTLAYAVSVHKSQGSEYPVIIVPMVTQHFMLLQRNLLYTALTRAKKLAMIVGSRKAVGIAIKNDKAEKRNTHLRYRLMEMFND